MSFPESIVDGSPRAGSDIALCPGERIHFTFTANRLQISAIGVGAGVKSGLSTNGFAFRSYAARHSRWSYPIPSTRRLLSGSWDESSLQRALRRARRDGDPPTAAGSLCRLGLIRAYCGDLAASECILRDALDAAESGDDRESSQ